MMKTWVLWSVCVGLGCVSTRVAAQYNDIRNPQTPEEIALIKKNNIMGETQYSLENDKKVPYYTRAFDHQGRQVISADYYNREYYLYDANGNVISFLDSVKQDSGFKTREYKFTYYSNGMLMSMTGPGMSSTFLYDPDKKELTEKLTRNDTAFTNIYRYDEKNRMKEAFYFDAAHNPVMHIMKNYGPDGRLFNEVYVTKSETFSDSTLTVYEYNDKKQLDKKQRFRFQNYYFSTVGAKEPDHSATHYDVSTSVYNLDDKGRPLEEQFTIKGDKLNYRYSTWTYNNYGLLAKETYRVGNAEPKIIVHQYIKFDN